MCWGCKENGRPIHPWAHFTSLEKVWCVLEDEKPMALVDREGATEARRVGLHVVNAHGGSFLVSKSLGRIFLANSIWGSDWAGEPHFHQTLGRLLGYPQEDIDRFIARQGAIK